MNRADEHSLAWALAQTARPLMNPDTHAWLCAKIGAGEQQDAIRDLLECFGRSGIQLSPELDDQLRRWIRGYSGSDLEVALRSLVDRVSARRADRIEFDATTGYVRSLFG